MTEATKNTGRQDDDIDLLLLLEKSIRFFNRYKWYFIIATFLGAGAGTLLYYKIPTTFESRLVVHSYMLTNQEQIQIANNWNSLLKKKEYPALARLFNCNETLLRKVKKIKAKEIQQIFTSTNPNGFTIDATVTDNAVLDSLQSGIVYAYENNEYVRERMLVKKAGLQELIDKTTAEISRLDSTKKNMERIIEGKGRISSPIIIDGTSINRQLVEMNEKLLSFKEALRFTNAVQVLQSFSKFSKPADPKLLPLLVIGLVFFWVIAYALSLVHSIHRKLKARRQFSTGD